MATRTTRTPSILSIIPKPSAADGLSRPRSRPNPCTPTQSTAATAQPARSQPATRKSGSASTITSAPPAAGTQPLAGAGLGAPRTPTRVKGRSGSDVDGSHARRYSDNGTAEDPEPDRACRPADERTGTDARGSHASEQRAGSRRL